MTTAIDDNGVLFVDGNTQKYPVVSVRQTVISGPVDTNGLPAFGGATGSTTVTASGTIVATAANGPSNRTGSKLNPSWAGLSSNGTMYLYVDVNADGTLTEGSGTLLRVERPGGTPSVTAGQHTFNYGEMKGYVGNGSTAASAYRVYVGEVTVSGGLVTAITWYAMNGLYRAPSGTTIANGSRMSFNHNLGTPHAIAQHNLICVSPVAGYSVGEWSSTAALVVNASGQPAFSDSHDRMTVGTFGGSSILNIQHRGTGGRTTIALTDFQYVPIVRRVF